MVSIYYSENNIEWTAGIYTRLAERLPAKEQIRMKRYVRWQDRQAGVIGKLLLQQGLADFRSICTLDDIVFNSYHKPYFLNGPFFNISHSGKYVVCCIADIPVGIDIEECKDIQIENFKSIFTSKEWENIADYEYKNRMFYEYWTKKESVIKADGKGINIPLHSIDVTKSIVNLDQNIWFLKMVEIDTDYYCCLALAADIEYVDIITIRKSYSEID